MLESTDEMLPSWPIGLQKAQETLLDRYNKRAPRKQMTHPFCIMNTPPDVFFM